jgi:hypothetical protein
MKSGAVTISGKVNAAMLEKADRLFRNDDDGVWIELLQNARRAGAIAVNITIEAAEANASPCTVTIQDDGGGIENFQSLVTLGKSDWSAATETREDPAGMGFFSLCRSEVEVHSGTQRVTISPSVFLGKSEAQVERAPFVRGTRIRFARESTKLALVAALERVSEFCPLEVRLDGQPLPRHDFLEGALHREMIDGIEVGFATAFAWKWNYYRDDNWNFYGARIREPFRQFTGLLDATKTGSELDIHARFNVLQTARVKLQLPDRRAIIQDEFFREFVRKAHAAAYRFFQTQERHALPFKDWQEAKELGVELPEAVCLLASWHASPQDENVEPLFGHPEQRLLPDASGVLLVERDVPDAHTLDAALQCGAALDGVLYEEKPEYAGYAWYDRLPRIVDTAVLFDGVLYDDWPETAERPAKIETEITIAESGQPEWSVRLPALIHAQTAELNEISFVAVRNSPWDNDELHGPFSISQFLVWAIFCASDDYGECDSWNTQMGDYEKEVKLQVNAYFRGPKASLVAILREAIDWDANRLAERLGVKEIHFRRTASSGSGWEIELVN